MRRLVAHPSAAKEGAAGTGEPVNAAARGRYGNDWLRASPTHAGASEPSHRGFGISKRAALGILFAASLLANGMFVGGVVRQWSEIRPALVRVAKPWLRSPQPQQKAALASIAQLVRDQTFASEEARIVFVRDFVYRHSIHRIDEEHARYAFDTPKVLEMLWLNRGSGQPPHLSCGPRALAMQSVLDALQIASRVVMIFSDNETEVVSHTFLEVYDHETRRWSIQDADFNVHYINLDTLESASTIELVWGDPDRFIPRSPDHDGWEENRLAHVKRDYFEAMIQLSHLDGGRSAVLVNLDRFDPARRFPANDGMNFYEFAKRHYANPAFVTNHTLQAPPKLQLRNDSLGTRTRS
jgi:hypothetical protein